MATFSRLVWITVVAVVLPMLMVIAVWTSVTSERSEKENLPRFDGWIHDENRIAILIAGSLQRFNLNSNLERLVLPLVRENWTVDLYLSIRMGKVQGWRQAADAFEPEGELKNLNQEGLETLLTGKVGRFGGTLVYQHIFDEIDLAVEDIDFIQNSTFFGHSARATVAKRNFLLLWKELHNLWYYAQAQEDLMGSYSYVMILREDSYWFQDFQLKKLLQIGGRQRVSGYNGNLFSLLCDKRYTRGGDLRGLIDYVFLLDRRGAKTMCNVYTHITRPASHGKSWFESYRQDYIIGVGSELLYLHMVKHFNVAVTEVPMSLMPMQRVARFHGQLCLHKYCDAKLASKNLNYFHPDMPLCKE